MSRLLRNIFMFVVYAYLYIPIIILVTNSFNEDRYGLSWKGFSWNWYERLFNNDTLIQAAFHSVTIAFFAATLATIVGGLTAIALYRYRYYCFLCSNLSNYCGWFNRDCTLSLSFPW